MITSCFFPQAYGTEVNYCPSLYMSVDYLSDQSHIAGIWDKGYQFSSVAQSCLTLCDPMNHRTPGLPVRHHLPEFTQTHFHRVGNAIQPSHPLPPILPRIRVFSNESTLRMRWPKYWSFSFSIIPSKEHPRLISFRMDWFRT